MRNLKSGRGNVKDAEWDGQSAMALLVVQVEVILQMMSKKCI
jgi:hypothetical protein